MASHTSVKDFLDMPALRFFEVYQAMAEVCEKRKKNTKG